MNVESTSTSRRKEAKALRLSHLLALPTLLLVLTGACGDDGDTAPAPTDSGVDTADLVPGDAGDSGQVVEATPGVQIQMDFTRFDGFYSAPFPDVSLVGDDGVDLSAFPNPSNIALVTDLVELAHGSAAFGTTSGVFFQVDGEVSADLPDLHQSIESSSPVALISVNPLAADYLHRYPVTVFFEADGGPFGASNLLSVVPLQGMPLLPKTTYAAVVSRELGDSRGAPLGVSLTMAQLKAGVQPEGLSDSAFEAHCAALTALEEAGFLLDGIAGLAVFETGDPTAEMVAATEQVVASPAPQPNSSFTPGDVFDEYCVFQTTIDMPTFQSGSPPFSVRGGGWEHDEGGGLILQGTEESNLVVTLPRTAMPDGGFPTVVFIRTGGGGDRPLVDRGHRSEAGGEADTPGSGPAMQFARAGYAGVSVDGPHGGLRNVSNGDEQFLMFNVSNPTALRDNIRQSALEIALLAHILDGLSIDATGCPDLGTADVSFDTGQLALMGHSMGATIAPLVLAVEPRYRAVILSGAGGSWIENVMFKLSPLEVKPIAEVLLQYTSIGRSIHRHDPVLSLLQWAGEPADPPVYGRHVVHEPLEDAPRHVLMLQGIVDTYIMPSIANATTLSLGLDLAGEPLDTDHPELSAFDPIEDLLYLVDGQQVSLPVSGNVNGTTTAVVVQHAEGPVEDGHEIAFQTEPPKHQYQCFLEGLFDGVPTVVTGNDESCE